MQFNIILKYIDVKGLNKSISEIYHFPLYSFLFNLLEVRRISKSERWRISKEFKKGSKSHLTVRPSNEET
jgi:hypothetical protein